MSEQEIIRAVLIRQIREYSQQPESPFWRKLVRKESMGVRDLFHTCGIWAIVSIGSGMLGFPGCLWVAIPLTLMAMLFYYIDKNVPPSR